MKVFKTCAHITRDANQVIEEIFRAQHDGRFFIVTEVCKTCFTELVLKNALESMSLGPAAVPTKMPAHASLTVLSLTTLFITGPQLLST